MGWWGSSLVASLGIRRGSFHSQLGGARFTRNRECCSFQSQLVGVCSFHSQLVGVCSFHSQHLGWSDLEFNALYKFSHRITRCARDP